VVGSCYAAVNNANCYGGNFAANDKVGNTGNVLRGTEIDDSIFSTSTTGSTLVLAMQGTAQPTSDNFPAVTLAATSGSKYTSGYECPVGTTNTGSSTFGACVVVAEEASGNSEPSSFVLFKSRNSVGTELVKAFQLTAKGVLQTGAPIGPEILTVATLPAASTVDTGAMVVVSDNATTSYGTCVGGGSVYAIAVSDGANWKCPAISNAPSGTAGGVLSGNYPNPAIAANANLGTPGTLVLTNATGLPCGAMPALTGHVTTPGGSCATTVSLTIPMSCAIVWGGTGTANALQSGDDAIANQSCYNKKNVTETITAVYCRSDAASNTTTVNPTFGTSGTGTTILSGALTCGSSGAYSATGTVTNASLTDGSNINPVMGGTLTGTSIHLVIEYTIPQS